MVLAACGGSQATSTATSEPTRPGPMATSSAHARPAVAPALAVPDTAKLVMVATAKGVQIYECEGTWELYAPRAELLDDSGIAIGQLYGGVDRGVAPGPWWEAKDGSTVQGSNAASVPNPGSIPLLRIDGSGATFTGDGGLLSYVAFIQRLDTTGGVAPTGACAAGQKTEVPYTAKYYFYAKG